MAESIDLAWFASLTDDATTRHNLTEIARIQRLTLGENRLIADDRPLCLQLGGESIWLEWGAAFSALEIYQEIFRNQEHSRVPGFLDGIGAGTILDLGANFGFFALSMKRRYPASRICCVEANPFVYPYLCRNLEANALSNVKALHAAVAGRSGTLGFDYIRQLPAISGKGIATVNRPWMRPEFVESTEVPALTIGEVIGACGDERIDLLKLDVEGMELEVLEGAGETLHQVDRLVVEYHSPALREGVAALMEGRGFALRADIRPPRSAYYGDLYFDNPKRREKAA